jgi:hypothetical protein
MNPYRRDTLLDGMLAHEDRFIGHRDELEWLLAKVSETRPAAVSLVGPWGVGKSFLLTYLENPRGARRAFKYAIGERFSDDPQRLLFVLLDFEDRAFWRAAPCLFELLYEQTLTKLAALLEIPDARLIPLDRIPPMHQPTVAQLSDLVQAQIARAREEAADDELRAAFGAALGTPFPARLFALLERLDAWGLRVVFLIDDFDTIIPALDRAAFDHLRTLITVASLVLVTHRALSKLVPAEVQSSPFFNLVQRLNLRRLYFWPPEEAQRMITEPPCWLKDPPELQFSPSDVAFILELTGLHPDLIRTVCEELYMRYRRRPPASGADVLPPDERSYLRAQLGTLFTDAFAAIWHRLDPDERAMLVRIAAGQVTIDEPPPPALTTLINRGYVVCEHGQYRLFAGLFHDYVLSQADSYPATQPVVRVALTDLEAKLLDLLKARPGETVDRDEIIAALYGVKANGGDLRPYRNRLDALLFRLREKLASEPVQIDNIRGQGYRLVFKGEQ